MEWISVEDKLPEQVSGLGLTRFSKQLLVCDSGGNFDIDYVVFKYDLFGESKEVRFVGDDPDKPITHWMPLPDSPEGI